MKKELCIFVAVLSLGMVGCNSSSDNQTHEHVFNMNVWEYDKDYHWHPSTCGHDVTTQKVTHAFSDVVTPATYEHGGYTTHSCTVCGYSYTDSETPQLTHNYSTEWSHDNQKHWHACIDIGFEDLKTNEANHTFSDVVTPATYEHGGYTTHSCTVCGYSYTDSETPQLTHNYSTEWSHDNQKHWHACTDSGYENLKKDEASHTFNDVVTPATYEHGGYTTRTCAICGYSYVTDETSTLKFTVTFLNYDDSLLHEVEVEKGGTAIYSWTNPTRPSDDTYTYSFAGWDKTLENVQESFSTKAIYNEIEKYTEGLQFEVNQSDGYSVVGYSGTSRNLIIPNKYSGKPVNRINDLAFANKNVSTLVIPNSITQIGTNILLNVSIQKLSAPFLGDGNGNNCYLSYFFGGVSYQDNETIVPSSLSEVTITGNRDIGQYAFYSCYLLTKVTISGEITQIGKYAFGETSALNSIILSNTISDIEDHAFYNSGLKSITIPEGVSTIKESCFERCNVLQYVIVSNADLLSSQLHAFYQCHNLKTTYFNGRLEQWKNVSFQEYFSNPCCYGAKAYVKDSNGNYIEAQNCINYHIIVPNEITTLSDETLASYLGTVDYSLFESIYVPDSINTINEGVLENFTNLKTISLPFIGINRYRQTLQSGHFGIIFGSESTSLGTTNYTSNYSRSGDSFYATPGYDYGYCHYSSVNRSDGKYQVFETTYGINFHYPSTLKNIIVRSGTIYAYAMYKINVENLYLFDDVIVENLAFSAAKITNLYTNLDIDTSFATNVFSLN